MTRLPSLNSLKTFVVAARSLNFTRAASELGVTQTAVSHQIRILEAYLQVQLFRRKNNALALTDKGRIYYSSLQSAFDLIVSATEVLRDEKSVRTLVLAVRQSFATWWLIPRLPKFHAQHPEIEVKLVSANTAFDFADDNIDAAIRPGLKWSSCDCECSKVLPIIISPVCSPRLLSASKGLGEPSSLAQQTILRVATAPDDWEIWLRSVGLEGLKGRRELVVDNYSYAWHLAARGVGIAMGRIPLIEQGLRSGDLLVPFPDHIIRRNAWYYLLWPKVGSGESEVQLFRHWLSNEIQEKPPTS
jgi:LysR family glycine cleavage system transcriptional activator